MTFRWFSIAAFAALFAFLLLHRAIFSPEHKGDSMIKGLNPLLLLQKMSLVERLYKLALLFGVLSFCVLGLTGFGPLLLGTRLEGYLLMIHATFAPVFIACAAVIAVLGARRNVFSKKDARGGIKAGFWFLLVMTLPVTLTMVLSMLPLFGPAGQEFLFFAHRWCTLIFALAAIIELHILIRMGVIEDV